VEILGEKQNERYSHNIASVMGNDTVKVGERFGDAMQRRDSSGGIGKQAETR
jgi:hypothetical protein